MGKETGERHREQVPNLDPYPPHSGAGERSSLTQHVLKDFVQSLCVLQNESMPLTILLGPQLIQFSPIHIQLAHPDGVDV